MYKKPNPITKPCRADDEDDCPPKLKYDIDSDKFCNLVQAHLYARMAAGTSECYRDLKGVQSRMRDTYHNLLAYISEFVEKRIKQAKKKDWRDFVPPGEAGQPLPDDHPLLQGTIRRKCGEDLPSKK
jgi:hypothetical protein